MNYSGARVYVCARVCVRAGGGAVGGGSLSELYRIPTLAISFHSGENVKIYICSVRLEVF